MDSSVCGHFICFYFLAIGNYAAKTKGVQICPRDLAFNSFAFNKYNCWMVQQFYYELSEDPTHHFP
jgi:hypothetical protein